MTARDTFAIPDSAALQPVTMKNAILLILLLVAQSCATYTSSLPQNPSTDDRLALVGGTLDCAARAQQSAFLWSLGSTISAGASTAVITVATNSANLTADGRTALGILSLGISGFSVVASIAAWRSRFRAETNDTCLLSAWTNLL